MSAQHPFRFQITAAVASAGAGRILEYAALRARGYSDHFVITRGPEDVQRRLEELGPNVQYRTSDRASSNLRQISRW